MIARRQLISLLGGAAAAWPVAAAAQQPDRMRRIGVLVNLAANEPEIRTRLTALQEGLEKLGWIEGRTVRIDYRYAPTSAEMRFAAAEMVALHPEVIFAGTATAAAAVQRATRNVPVVFATAADPVAAGLVASLARPGGNMTGFAMFEFGIGAKWLELLKQIAPSLERIAVIYDPGNPTSTGFLPMIDAGARSYGAQVFPAAARDAAEIESAITEIAREPNGGLIVLPGALTAMQREQIISLATRHRLPNVHPYRYYPASGGLSSYGASNVSIYRSSASYIDRILRGEKPADLPVQLPTKFELVINLKTAKALGLTVPDTLLVRADEVIE